MLGRPPSFPGDKERNIWEDYDGLRRISGLEGLVTLDQLRERFPQTTPNATGFSYGAVKLLENLGTRYPVYGREVLLNGKPHGYPQLLAHVHGDHIGFDIPRIEDFPLGTALATRSQLRGYKLYCGGCNQYMDTIFRQFSIDDE